MDVRSAIQLSDCGMAEMRSDRTINRPVAVKIKQDELRIVSSVTDPTVKRRLRFHELNSESWYPVTR